MFELICYVKDLGFSRLVGVDALDWRRRWRLADGTSVKTWDYGSRESERQGVVVDEAFARTWFPTNASYMFLPLDLCVLYIGELGLDRHDQVVPNLSTERAKELYVDYRRAIEDEVKLHPWKAWWRRFVGL